MEEATATFSPEWAPGVNVGAFRLIRSVAKGGMGEVWLAKQVGLAGFERLVAIKRIIVTSEDDPSMLTMFLDEARIAAQLHHSNIVQVFDLGQAHGSYYLVMEYLRGESLARTARRLMSLPTKPPRDLWVQVIIEAAKGLGHAHRKVGLDGQPMGIVHRDVSPQNIFVTYDGQVKVLDFGIAKAAGRSSKTQTGVIRGRLAYMSPEQAMGVMVSHDSDVFSLAVILYELLSGARRYAQADDIAIFRMLAEGTQPLPLTDYGVDPALSAIVHRGMAWKGSERYVDGIAFAEALSAWQRANPAESHVAIDQVMVAAFKDEMAARVEIEKEKEITNPIGRGTPVTGGSNSLPDLGQPKLRSQSNVTRRIAIAGGIVASLVLGVGGVFAFNGSRQRVAPPVVESPKVAVPVPVPVAPVVTPDAGLPAVAVAVDAGAPPELAVVTPTPTPTPTPVKTNKPPEKTTPVAAPTAKGKMGSLTLQTEPWVQVFEGKKSLGETPLVEVPMAAGKHRLHLVNPDQGIDTVIEANIAEGVVTTKKLAL